MTARILVVDDNPMNLKLLVARLTHEYYIVTTATNGVEALEKLEQEKPDLILLDVMMPQMDGFETCQRIKSNPETEHIPVVMETALADVADRVRGLNAGADDFLSKPINEVALMARVRSLLRLKMLMDEWRLRESTSDPFAGQGDIPVEKKRPLPPRTCKVLVLEDNSYSRDFIRDTLEKLPAEVVFASTVAEATAMARANNYDIVFASLDLRDEDGLHACAHLRTQSATRQTPILLLANDSEMGRVAKGLDLGANDYLLRPIDANELVARTQTQLKHKRHYDELRRNYEDNISLALVDPLTGAFNRRYLEAYFPRVLARSLKNGKPLSLMMIDVDHFKKVNDTRGHAAGDATLRMIVDRIVNGIRPADLMARLGGEEFIVVMPETSLDMALSIAERLRERISSSPIELPSDTHASGFNPLEVTISIGCTDVAESDENCTLESVLKRADTALYKAKNAGRNRVVCEPGKKA
ncbi:MAG: PleD family two-component system response regulator [Bdellovibrionales bacterium]